MEFDDLKDLEKTHNILTKMWGNYSTILSPIKMDKSRLAISFEIETGTPFQKSQISPLSERFGSFEPFETLHILAKKGIIDAMCERISECIDCITITNCWVDVLEELSNIEQLVNSNTVNEFINKIFCERYRLKIEFCDQTAANKLPNDLIAFSSKDGTVKLLRIRDNKLLRVLRGHTDHVMDVKFSPDGKIVASCSYEDDGSVKLWTVDKGEAFLTYKTNHTVRSISFQPKKKYSILKHDYIAVCGDSNEIIFANYKKEKSEKYSITRTLERSKHHNLNMTAREICFSPDALKCVFCNDEGDISESFVKMLDLRGGEKKIVWSYKQSGWILSVKFSPDGTKVIFGADHNVIGILDASTGLLIRTIISDNTDSVRSVDFSPDGSKIASCGFDGKVNVWETETGKNISTSRCVHSYHISAVKFMTDNLHVITAGFDGRIGIWRAETGNLVTMINNGCDVTSADCISIS